nr:hypothetical protein [Tanacetum cinerariifolium]
MNAMSCGLLLYFVSNVSGYPKLQLLVHTVGLVPTSSGTTSAGHYKFILLDWFLLVVDDHNKVAYLEKGKGWEAYEQILDFLNRSHIRYALTHRPTIVFDSLVKQFWATATVHTLEAGPSDVIATIDGYPTDGSLTFYKAKLLPQWRFLIHILIHCMSPKSGGGISSLTSDPSPIPTFDFTAKLFSNMKLNWDGPHMPLLASMFVVPAGGDGADAAAEHDVSPPPIVPPTHSTPGPSSAPQVTRVREPTPVKDPTLVRDPTPVKDPTPVREPTPSPVREPTPDSPRPPFPPPRSEEVATTAAGGAEDSAALTALSLKLDRCLHRVTTLENELGITKKVLGGAFLKLVTRVKQLEGHLQQWKRRLVLSDSEGEDATPTEHDIDFASLHTLTHTSLGDDSSAPATGPDANTTMPFRSTSTTRRRLRKSFTSSGSVHVSKNIPAGTSVHAATTIPAGSSVDAAIHAVAAPSSSIPTAADKGKAPMVDDSLPAHILSEQECVLKNLHDAQLGEELVKKIHAEQEADLPDSKRSWHRRLKLNVLARTVGKIATNFALSKQLLGDDVTEENMNERLGMLFLRKRRELAKQSRVKPMTKIQQRDYMRDFVKNNSALVYNQGWTMKKVKAFSIAQLRIEFEYIQQHLKRSNLLNFRHFTFRAKPTLDAPSAKRANQGAPQTVVHTAESHLDDPLTASEHVSTEPTIVAPTPSSSRTRRKHIAKKRVTPIVDMADVAMIKFNSDSDDDPLPY